MSRAASSTADRTARLRVFVWTLLALPALGLTFAAFTNRLGANPAEALVRGLGDWALRALLLTLAVTPLRTLTGWAWLARGRRWCGVATFVYASLHLLAYAWFDLGFVVADFARDLAKRPFILVGMLTWLTLLPLALTSTNAAIRRLGAAPWKRLHQLVHVAAALALLHYFWMKEAKADFALWRWHAAALAVLWGWRLLHRRRTRSR